VRISEKVLQQGITSEACNKRILSGEKEMEKITGSGQDKKRIFLSGSIRGGRQLLETYRFMYDTLNEAGAEVLSWHVADPELEETESKMTEREIYNRDIGLLAESDALIAEVTVPSTGVGYEICRALARKIPVLCLHRPGAAVSAMVLGNPGPSLEVRNYLNEETLKKILVEFIQAL
jgi:hypothetical protein